MLTKNDFNQNNDHYKYNTRCLEYYGKDKDE